MMTMILHEIKISPVLLRRRREREREERRMKKEEENKYKEPIIMVAFILIG